MAAGGEMARRDERTGSKKAERVAAWLGAWLATWLMTMTLTAFADPRSGALSAAHDIQDNDSNDISGCRHGYRLQSVIRDFAMGQEWAVLASCAHPETPWIAIAQHRPAAEWPLPAALAVSDLIRGAAYTVRSGSRVRLWLRTPVARIDLSGIAMEGGAPGEMIRVRIAPGGKVFRGTVRAAGSVELDAAGGQGFRGEGQ
jgi:Chaperone for flagella basal body P-ring formation